MLAKTFLKNVVDALGDGYVWGGNGQVYTEKLAQSWNANRTPPPGKAKGYFIVACKKWIGKRVRDCSGLVTSCAGQGKIGSSSLINMCKMKGPIDEIPDVPALLLWRPGHVGVYMGTENVIESAGTAVGVITSELKRPATGKAWVKYGYLPFIEYPANPVIKPSTFRINRIIERMEPMMHGADVLAVKKRLVELGYLRSASKDTFGDEARDALVAFQKSAFPNNPNEWDGRVGKNTIQKLGGTWGA